MKKLIFSLFIIMAITYGALIYFAQENYQQTKIKQRQIDSLKQITNGRP